MTFCLFWRWSSGQRESFFQSRDENESFSDSISFIETRPRVPDTYSQASRRDRGKISPNLGYRDEIEIYYLHSQASRREREFPWSDLVFRDETENSETCHLSLKSGLNGLTILHAIFGRLTILNAGPHNLLDVLPFWNDPVMFFGQVYKGRWFGCTSIWKMLDFSTRGFFRAPSTTSPSTSLGNHDFECMNLFLDRSSRLPFPL